MGNAAWGAGRYAGMGEGLALGEDIGRSLGEAAGLRKGVAIGVAASAAVMAAGVGLWRLEPWKLISQHFPDREQDPIPAPGDEPETRETTTNE
ncbi:hypothetical protein [Actinoplanes rectilineatus]|uniref:hypothetical protein n=1 Tax=Actinoplanes rectilineatus TaxID=113571 RepID=UPI0005F2AF0E|nr:hypothetical protein [Actinoplanes rectilineatus]